LTKYSTSDLSLPLVVQSPKFPQRPKINQNALKTQDMAVKTAAKQARLTSTSSNAPTAMHQQEVLQHSLTHQDIQTVATAVLSVLGLLSP